MHDFTVLGISRYHARDQVTNVANKIVCTYLLIETFINYCVNTLFNAINSVYVCIELESKGLNIDSVKNF